MRQRQAPVPREILPGLVTGSSTATGAHSRSVYSRETDKEGGRRGAPRLRCRQEWAPGRGRPAGGYAREMSKALAAFRISAHSTRIGAAQDLTAAGASLPEIMVAGG
jgi:hypothetical protein